MIGSFDLRQLQGSNGFGFFRRDRAENGLQQEQGDETKRSGA